MLAASVGDRGTGSAAAGGGRSIATTGSGRLMVMLIRTSDRRRGAAEVGSDHFGGGTVSQWMWVCVSMHRGERVGRRRNGNGGEVGVSGIVTLTVGSLIYLSRGRRGHV